MSRKQLADASWFKFWKFPLYGGNWSLPFSAHRDQHAGSIPLIGSPATSSLGFQSHARFCHLDYLGLRTRSNSWTVKKGTEPSATRYIKVHTRYTAYTDMEWYGALWSHAPLRHEHPFCKALLKRMVIVGVWMLFRRSIRELLQDNRKGQTTGFPDATGHKVTHFITIFCSPQLFRQNFPADPPKSKNCLD